MQPFVLRLLILPVEVSHGDRDWLYQPGLNHADSKPLIFRLFKAKRILQRIHFHHMRRRRRRLTVEPSSSLRSAIIDTRTDLLTSQESTTLIPSKEVGGYTASESLGLQSNKGSADKPQHGEVFMSVQLVRVEDCNGRVKDSRNFTVTTSSKILLF